MSSPEQFDAGLVNWDDPSFVPAERPSYGDPLRLFRMSNGWPNQPFQDRKFQLGGKERFAFFEETVFHFWAHRFSVNYLGSAVNGTRRCTKDSRGTCVACDHYDSAPPDPQNPRKKKAHCGPRQQQFGANILVYKTDLEGNLVDAEGRPILLDDTKGPVLQNGQPAELVYEIFLWRFSSDKFTAVRQLKKDWGTLLKNDFTATLAPGKPEQFQDFTININPKSAWLSYALDKPAGTEKAKQIRDYYKENRYDVTKILGREHSDEEMLRFLGLGGSGQNGAPSGEAVRDVADEIAAKLAEIDADITPDVPSTPTPPAQVAPSPAPEPTPAPTVSGDFDDLLGS